VASFSIVVVADAGAGAVIAVAVFPTSLVVHLMAADVVKSICPATFFIDH